MGKGFHVRKFIKGKYTMINSKKKDKEIMKLSEHIYYRRYLDDTVVCDTKYHKFYVMNAIAFDILEILSAGIRSSKDVVDKLIIQYSADLVEIEEACDSFISELQTLGMMESKESTLTSTVSYDADYEDTDIEQDYIRQLARKKILYSALIELTYQCNLTCKHCYIINSKKEAVKNFVSIGKNPLLI